VPVMKLKESVLRVQVAVFVILTAFVTGHAQKVTYESFPGIDLTKYKTYNWKRADKAQYPDLATDELLRRSVDAQLQSKGYAKTENDSADLYVTYQLAITDDAQWSSFTNEIHWQGGANSLPGFKGSTTNGSELIRKGWIILELYDVSQKKYVWRASANKTLGNANNPKKMEQNAEKAMAKVFNNFPKRAN
jgi:hypothetical protein